MQNYILQKWKKLQLKKKYILYNEKGNDQMSHSDSIPKLIKLWARVGPQIRSQNVFNCLCNQHCIII